MRVVNGRVYFQQFDGYTGLALWSSDGTSFGFLARGDKVVHPEVVYTVPTTGGEPANITPDYWGTFEHLEPDGDGGALIAYGTEGVFGRLTPGCLPFQNLGRRRRAADDVTVLAQNRQHRVEIEIEETARVFAGHHC